MNSEVLKECTKKKNGIVWDHYNLWLWTRGN